LTVTTPWAGWLTWIVGVLSPTVSLATTGMTTFDAPSSRSIESSRATGGTVIVTVPVTDWPAGVVTV